MEIYYYEYEKEIGSRVRSKDSRAANSKAHLIRILKKLNIIVIKNTIEIIR